MKILVGARNSLLSQVQVQEVLLEIQSFFPEIRFDPVFVKTSGDLDQKTSLRDLEKTDFFTKEIDRMVLSKKIRIAVHSAKDLPDPLPPGLAVVALTKGKDPSDCLVMREGDSLERLPKNAVIGTSTRRREEAVLRLRSDILLKDLRGDILQRLQQLEKRAFDGIILAEAAILRLKLHHLNRMILPGETAPLQGRLAVVARKDDGLMRKLFSQIHFS
ncbi:MAG: hydroxymethylbilane synthase [Simkaniaceae bacterium]